MLITFWSSTFTFKCNFWEKFKNFCYRLPWKLIRHFGNPFLAIIKKKLICQTSIVITDNLIFPTLHKICLCHSYSNLAYYLVNIIFLLCRNRNSSFGPIVLIFKLLTNQVSSILGHPYTKELESLFHKAEI